MKAHLRSVRIAPKKANLVAGMVRGLTVQDALSSLQRTNKRAARILEELIKSAVANAEHNNKQESDMLVIKSLVVNQAQAYHRGVPMARGRVRPMRKFLSHISVTLGVKEGASEAKSPKSASQSSKKSVKETAKSSKGTSSIAKKKGDTAATDSQSAVSKKTKKAATSSKS